MQDVRTKKLGIHAVLLLTVAAGCVFLLHIGKPIPCVFHMVTGLKCPGCGITHLLLALARGRIKEAFLSNPAVFLILPVLGTIMGRAGIRYVRTGAFTLRHTEENVLIGMAVLLVFFGIVRNIAGI